MNINELVIAVSNYGRKFGVLVRVQGQTAYTNGKVVTIPRLKTDLTEYDARIVYAYLAHESGHIRYSDFTRMDSQFKDGYRKTLFNVLEDVRIELLMGRLYIGVYENLKLLNLDNDNDFVRAFMKTASLNNLILSYLQLYGHVNVLKYDERKPVLDEMYKKLKSSSLGAVLDQIIDCYPLGDDSDKTFEAVEKIYDLIKGVLPPKSLRPLSSATENDARCKVDIDAKISSGEKGAVGNSGAGLYFDPDEFKDNFSVSKDTAIFNGLMADSSSSRDDLGNVTDICRCQKGDVKFGKQAFNMALMANALRSQIRANVMSACAHSEMGHRLDARRLVKLPVGETRIFKSNTLCKEINTNVHICVDVSSSMLSSDGQNTTRCDEACLAALYLCKSLKGIYNVDCSCTFFPGIRSEFEIALKCGEPIDCAYFDQRPRGSTPLAQVLTYVGKQCLGSSERDRNVVIVITDGMPDSVKNVQECFKLYKKLDIELYCISIRSEVAKNLFEKAVVVDSANNIFKCATKYITDLFSTRRMSALYSVD